MSLPVIATTELNGTANTDIAIIGGGIAGLTAATLLCDAGFRVKLLEARQETGGRIRSARDRESGHYLADLGPTWVWPAYQPVISRWLERLALPTMPQFDTGKVVAEMSRSAPPITTYLPGQDGQVRIIGGPQAIVDKLTTDLPPGVLRLGAQVTDISLGDAGGSISFNNQTLFARKIVLSVPPRIAVETINWRPGIPEELRNLLSGLPTWMAAHAKIVVHYDAPFWRERGLSGRIISRAGPLGEVHDHSGPDGLPAALFGFSGWPHSERKKLGNTLTAYIEEQLARCLGPDAPAPNDIVIKDWAADPFVSVPADISEVVNHPIVAPNLTRQLHFDNKVCFAVAETAAQSPGLIEGAFVAGEHAARVISSHA